MATQVSTKVRLVRCPKCRQVLAELPDVKLYKCGGCGTVLQAKTRNVEANHTESSSQSADSVANVQQNNAPEEEEARSSNHDLSNLRNGDPEINRHETENSTVEVKEPSRHDDEEKEWTPEASECSTSHNLDRYTREDSFEGGESQRLCQEGDNIVDRLKNLPENGDQENDTPSSGGENGEGRKHSYVSLKKADENGGLCGEVVYAGLDSSSALILSHENVNASQLAKPSAEVDGGLERKLSASVEDSNVVSHDYRHLESPMRKFIQNFGNASSVDTLASSSIVDHPTSELSSNHDLSSLQNGDSEVNSNKTENSTVEVKEPSRHDEAKEWTPDTNHNLDHDTRLDGFDGGESQRLCQEGDNVVDRLENLPENGDRENDMPSSGDENGEVRKLHGYVSLEKEEKACSADENGGLCREIGYPGLGFSSAHILSHKNVDASQLAEPSTEVDGGSGKKLSASVEDSSAVSHDYVHLYRPMRKFRQNFGSASSVDTLASSPLVDYPTSELSIKHRDMRSNFPTTRNYYGYDGSESYYDDDQSPQHISHLSRRKSTTVQKVGAYKVDEMLSSEPEMNYSKLPFTDRTESPSIYKRNLVPRHPRFSPQDNKPSCSEPDELELLRTVQDLKDELNRIQFLKARSPYYEGLTPEREIYADANLPRYHLHNQERRNVSRLAFSGEAAHFRHQINSSCLHCCPQDWHRSAQLPSGYCGVHTGHSHCNVSSFSSPEHYTSSELSVWAHETQIDNLRRRDREMQRLLREKYHTAKRHLRPVAGGAPVVPCYHCSELLQLPADFLLFKKRYHQLKCGACGKILRFSLLRNKHIVPYLPDAANQRTFESMSDSCQRVEHVACNRVERNKNRKMSSGSSYDLTGDRRMKSIMKERHKKNMDMVESFESVGASSGKLKGASSESEKMPALTNSPLHRLMGYGSARRVLNR